MGCGPSQPVKVGSEKDALPVTYPRRTLEKQDSVLSSKLTDTATTTGTEESSSR